MKKIIFCLTLSIFAIKLFGQTTTSPALLKNNYLKKSKTQKTIGWVMLGSGVTMATVGALIFNNHTNGDPLEGFDYILSKKSQGAAILVVAGIGTALGSIPFFISSAKNKRRGAAVSLGTSNTLLLQQNVFAFKKQPAIILRIRL